MNQILVTQKLYVTPELKRKKRIYKIYFILSVLLVIFLISAYFYAEYNRSQEEGVARDILGVLGTSQEDTPDDTSLNLKEEEIAAPEDSKETPSKTTTASKTKKTKKVVHTQNGDAYISLATVYIPSLNIKYPVLQPDEQTLESIEKTLKISPCKFYGPEVNTIGNFCIVGHNYRNTKFFSKVPNMESGDVIELTGVNGSKVQYKVYDKYVVTPDDVTCTDQRTNGRREITLITCTNNSEKRWIVKAREA